MRFSKISLFLFIFSLIIQSSTQASQKLKIRVQPTKSCNIVRGYSDIPLIRCAISTGIQTSSAKASQLRLNIGKEIPYMEAPSYWDVSPNIIERDGVYAVEISFLDIGTDGFSAEESQDFLEYIIDIFDRETHYLEIESSANIKVNSSQSGLILK